MVDVKDSDRFTANPYDAPKTLVAESGVVAASPVRPLVLIGSVAVVIAEATMTLALTVFHDDSPYMFRVNVFAVTHLLSTGLITVCMSWLFGSCRPPRKAHIASQYLNVLVWATFVLTLMAVWPLAWFQRATQLFLLAAFSISAVCCLAATFASSRVFLHLRR